jgi:hypothetical protein
MMFRRLHSVPGKRDYMPLLSSEEELLRNMYSLYSFTTISTFWFAILSLGQDSHLFTLFDTVVGNGVEGVQAPVPLTTVGVAANRRHIFALASHGCQHDHELRIGW